MLVWITSGMGAFARHFVLKGVFYAFWMSRIFLGLSLHLGSDCLNLHCLWWWFSTVISTNLPFSLTASHLGEGRLITAQQSQNQKMAAVVGSPLFWVQRQLLGQEWAMAMSRVLPSVRAQGTLSPPLQTERRQLVPVLQRGTHKGGGVAVCRACVVYHCLLCHLDEHVVLLYFFSSIFFFSFVVLSDIMHYFLYF